MFKRLQLSMSLKDIIVHY